MGALLGQCGKTREPHESLNVSFDAKALALGIVNDAQDLTGRKLQD